jgi:hypothetical protein
VHRINDAVDRDATNIPYAGLTTEIPYLKLDVFVLYRRERDGIITKQAPTSTVSTLNPMAKGALSTAAYSRVHNTHLVLWKQLHLSGG